MVRVELEFALEETRVGGKNIDLWISLNKINQFLRKRHNESRHTQIWVVEIHHASARHCRWGGHSQVLHLEQDAHHWGH